MRKAVPVVYRSCVHGVPFGAFALASCLLAVVLMTALASYSLPFLAKQNLGHARERGNEKRARPTGHAHYSTFYISHWLVAEATDGTTIILDGGGSANVGSIVVQGEVPGCTINVLRRAPKASEGARKGVT